MISTASLMVLAALLFIKHLLADGPLQTGYQLRHKGDFLHPGGLLHSFIHVALSLVCVTGWLLHLGMALDGPVILLLTMLVAFEFVTHYMTDWLKVQADRRFNWSSVKPGADGEVTLVIHSSNFFVAFLADQTVHSLTYLLMVYLVGVAF